MLRIDKETINSVREQMVAAIEKLIEKVNSLKIPDNITFIAIPSYGAIFYIDELKMGTTLDELTGKTNISSLDPAEYDFRWKIILKVDKGKVSADEVRFMEPIVGESDKVSLPGWENRDRDYRYLWFYHRVLQNKPIDEEYIRPYSSYVSHLLDDAIYEVLKTRNLEQFELIISNLFQNYLKEDLFDTNGKLGWDKDHFAFLLPRVYTYLEEYDKAWDFYKKYILLENKKRTPKNFRKISVTEAINILSKRKNKTISSFDILAIVSGSMEDEKLNITINQYLSDFEREHGQNYIIKTYQKYNLLDNDLVEVEKTVKQKQVRSLRSVPKNKWKDPFEKNDFFSHFGLIVGSDKSVLFNILDFQNNKWITVPKFIGRLLEHDLNQLVEDCRGK